MTLDQRTIDEFSRSVDYKTVFEEDEVEDNMNPENNAFIIMARSRPVVYMGDENLNPTRNLDSRYRYRRGFHTPKKVKFFYEKYGITISNTIRKRVYVLKKLREKEEIENNKDISSQNQSIVNPTDLIDSSIPSTSM
ncbi:hypothetical protein A3Q56_02590 [Intoshia linei]|uniref:Uncharacterized protein n=1 Tax=Intoshia linei TaxID=1819745 RepID=A0A177B5X6_9BILA|nr:hypothetical protein A3Q56_02590 [Intoshia linei]